MAAHAHRQCCCTVRACPGCSPSASSVVATISGLTLCLTCKPLAGGGYGVLSGGTSVDGTYALTQDATDPCLWVYRQPIGIALTQYSGSSCTGSVTAVRDYFAIRFRISITQQVVIGFENAAYTGGTASAFSTSGYSNCAAPFSHAFTNNTLFCPTIYGSLGYGGTVTITAT